MFITIWIHNQLFLTQLQFLKQHTQRITNTIIQEYQPIKLNMFKIYQSMEMIIIT